MTNAQLDDTPWYRHRMVWLVIAIPGLTVAGCMLTIYLAISNTIFAGNFSAYFCSDKFRYIRCIQP